MTLSLGAVDYAVIGVMLAISAGVGVFFRFTGGRQKTTEEFLMAGRNMSILPVAFSLMATYMSAIALLGIPSETYLYGTQIVVWSLGAIVGSFVAAYMYVPVFFDMEACTAYEYLERRFGKTTRGIVSFMFSLQMIFYMAVVLYAPSLALNAVTGLSTWASVITIAVVCTFYCSLGGLKAVLWTDVFQAVLMYVTVFSVIIKGTIDVGGLKESFDIANRGNRLVIFEYSPNLQMRYTFWNCMIGGIHFSISTFGTNQAQIQRMLTVKSLKKSQIALFISVPMIIVFVTCCCWDGVVIYAAFHDCDPILSSTNVTTSPDQFLPYAVLKMFSHWPGVAGLCIAGVFSAALSTISSAVNSLTAVTMEDFIRPHCSCKKLTESWATFLAKIIAVGYGGICLLLTFIVANFRGVLEASGVLFGMVGGPILGIFSLGLLTTKTNEKGALFGILAGLALNAWIGFGSMAAEIKMPTLRRSTEGCPLINGTSIAAEPIDYEHLFSSEYADEQNKDILPAYKVSYLWFSVFGTISAYVIGYLASWIIDFFEEQAEVKPEYISPPLRKYYFRMQQECADKNGTEMSVQGKQKDECERRSCSRENTTDPSSSTSHTNNLSVSHPMRNT